MPVTTFLRKPDRVSKPCAIVLSQAALTLQGPPCDFVILFFL